MALHNKLFPLPRMIPWHLFAYETPIPSQKGEYYHPDLTDGRTEVK